MQRRWLWFGLALVAGCALPNDYSRGRDASSNAGSSTASPGGGVANAGRAASSGQVSSAGSTSGTNATSGGVGGVANPTTAGVASGSAGASNSDPTGVAGSGGTSTTSIPVGGSTPLTTSGGASGAVANGGNAGRSSTVTATSSGSTAGGGGLSLGGASGGNAGGNAGGSPAGGGLAGAGASTGGMATGGSLSSAGTSASGSATTAGTAGTVNCPTATLLAPAMRPMPEGFCIDVSEVTRAQYQSWLATDPNPLTIGQDPTACGWNSSFIPDFDCMTSSTVCTGNCGDHPMVCVDWCDAFAYCKAMGRRLCGNIQGGSNTYNDFASSTKSQWYAACSSGGRHPYPYGDSYDMTRCQSPADWASTATTQVMSHGSCQSGETGYEGVFDLSGNVWEWEDSCSDNSDGALCHLRGGSFLTYDGGPTQNEKYASCTHGGENYRKYFRYSVGFRCCS